MMKSRHKQRLAEDFSASARLYDRYAFLQRRVLRALAGEYPGGLVLDSGCGTGDLAQHWPGAEIIGFDLAPGMCREAAHVMPVAAADMEHLPFRAESFDGVFSSLALQWLEHPGLFFAEAWRVVRPGGWVRLATLTQGTLAELRHAYEAAGLSAPVLDFATQETIQQQLEDAGWLAEDIRVKHMETAQESVRDLLHQLKGLGARHKQQRGMRSPGDLRKLEAAYPQKSASWQVMFIDARKS